VFIFDFEVKPMKTKFILLGAMLAANFGVAQSDWERAGGSMGRADVPQKQETPGQINRKTSIYRTKLADGQIYRVLSGKTYNVIENPQWQPVIGDVYEKLGKILILQTGGYRDWTYVAITNYPSEVLADKQIRMLAVQIGIYDMNDRPIALYDFGKPYIQPPPTPEEIAAAKAQKELSAKAAADKACQLQSNAIRWLQPQATNGDASAQCSLGLHYLNGQGCETNRERGIYWLTQAADQGNMEASNKLSKLKYP
jgi:TPR repeat protein